MGILYKAQEYLTGQYLPLENKNSLVKWPLHLLASPCGPRGSLPARPTATAQAEPGGITFS